MINVSVIIPCFNRSHTIRRAIDSALGQSLRDIEVVVVDDGSTDSEDLRGVIDSLGDERVRLIRHTSNQGGGAARNTGVRAARGAYIAFLDSDDEWHQDKLQQQAAQAALQAGDCFVIYSQSQVVTWAADGKQHRTIMPRRFKSADESLSDYLFVNGGWMQTTSLFMPQPLALEVAFNESLRRHQDYDVLLRLEAMGCRFEGVQQPLATVHWETAAAKQRQLATEDSLIFLKEYGGYMSDLARTAFVVHQVVLPLMAHRSPREALKRLSQHSELRLIPTRDWFNLVSFLLFADARVTRFFARFKRSLNGVRGA